MNKDAPYTLIAYKPDSNDYCRGCHMASYPSSFQFQNHLSKEKLIEEFSKLIAYNLEKLDCNEDGYCFIVLREGICVFNNESSGRGEVKDWNIAFDLDDDYSDEYILKEESFKAEMKVILDEANLRGNDIAIKERQKEEAEKAKAATLAKQEEYNRKKREYEQLKKEFGE